MIRILAPALLAWPVLAPQTTQVVVLEAQADATLIEHPEGLLANGRGPHVSVGRTNQPAAARRRGVLRFDVAGALPPNARIEDVTVLLHASQGGDPPVEVRLHRLLQGWSEGPSLAPGGQGVPAQAGDVTWMHRTFPELLWARPGGTFRPVPSAATLVEAIGPFAWSQSPHLVNDVRHWLKAPGQNHGWVLIGDEEVAGGAVRFASREHPDPALRPLLEIRYTLPGPRR